MSEVVVPPPPPPPPPPQRTGPAFDFGKPFQYVFEDPKWVEKILIGGLFYLAVFAIIGWFFILGYAARTARNIIRGDETPLPEWTDVGQFFSEGARLVGVALCYTLPMFVIVMTFVWPMIFADAMDSHILDAFAGGMAMMLSCIVVPLSLAMMIFMPASLLFAAVEQRFSAAFEFNRIWLFIRNNVGNYLLAVVVYLVARFVAGAGIIACCIGVIFTGFWSILIMTHGFAQAYKLAKR
jgi:Protein of unknown function (DUF4013)